MTVSSGEKHIYRFSSVDGKSKIVSLRVGEIKYLAQQNALHSMWSIERNEVVIQKSLNKCEAFNVINASHLFSKTFYASQSV